MYVLFPSKLETWCQWIRLLFLDSLLRPSTISIHNRCSAKIEKPFPKPERIWGYFFVFIYSRSFQTQPYWHVGLDDSRWWRAVLCSADLQQQPWSVPTRCRRHTRPPVLWRAKMSPDVVKCPLGFETLLVENHWSVVKLSFSPSCVSCSSTIQILESPRETCYESEGQQEMGPSLWAGGSWRISEFELVEIFCQIRPVGRTVPAVGQDQRRG